MCVDVHVCARARQRVGVRVRVRVRERDYRLAAMLSFEAKPLTLSEKNQTASAVADSIAIFLPRNANVAQLIALAASSASPSRAVEIEKNFVNARLKAITAYYGPLVAWS